MQALQVYEHGRLNSMPHVRHGKNRRIMPSSHALFSPGVKRKQSVNRHWQQCATSLRVHSPCLLQMQIAMQMSATSCGSLVPPDWQLIPHGEVRFCLLTHLKFPHRHIQLTCLSLRDAHALERNQQIRD